MLHERALPSWSAIVDGRYGGYLLSPTEKQLATQSRMVWAFSHAHRLGLGDYLWAAERGVELLLGRFADGEHGGFFWKTDRAGRPLDRRKLLYGHAFVIYALVEYGRAGGDPGALDRALALFRLLRERAHDGEHGGWLEHFEPDWRPILRPDVRVEVETAGAKSANSHLHVLEALTELYAESGDGEVGVALGEAIEVCTTQFLPADPAASVRQRSRDWRPAGPRGPSVGHSVELAWLLTHAEGALGLEPSWERLDAYLAYALAAPAADRIWWETAETLAALATAVAHRPDPGQLAELERRLSFALAHQVDPVDGLWLHAVAPDGSVVNPEKIATWKDAYHELRATVLLAEVGGGRGPVT